MLNYNHLYYFYIAAKSGGITSAARILKVSQPSLSSQIKVLEGTLDLVLFRKVGRKNELTEAGLVVFGFCRRMFEVSEELSELVMERLPSVSRRVSIGISDQIDRNFTIEIVSSFLKKHGTTVRPKISLLTGTHEVLSDRLKFRDLDVIFTHLPMLDPDLKNLESIESPVGLFSCKPNPLSDTDAQNVTKSSIQNLVGGTEAYWVQAGIHSKLRAETDQFFEQYEIKGRVVFESDIPTSLTRAVTDGIGTGFLPLLYVAKELAAKKLFQIGAKKGYWNYKVWLGCHTQNADDPLIRSLSRSFLDVSNEALLVLS
ncbi:MAG: LysR family transcriptional regulator [Proteobacteria bacterium]|nr:LysR family transcriptional regulator [Pseudomonadota bacterium]